MAEALALHLRGQEEDGDVVEEPSGIEAGYVWEDFVPRTVGSREQTVAVA